MTVTSPPPATVTERITTAGVPRRRRKATPGRALLYGVLTLGAVISLFPLYWLVVMASNSTSDIYTTRCSRASTSPAR
ncbi:MAG: sugar transporter permease [Microbacterium sp.]|nr:sugar transporter permease [Microbacterium sp.]